jgi:hypothetical protein
MKRINPQTNRPYKLGDFHQGMYFYNYRSDILANGFRGERWLTEEALERAIARDKLAKMKKRRQAGKLPRVLKSATVHA